MAITINSKLNIERGALNTQTISVDVELNKQDLKLKDGDRFLFLLSLHNAADDSFLKELGCKHLYLPNADPNELKFNLSTSVEENVLNINQGMNRAGGDRESETVYVKTKVFRVDSDPVTVSTTNSLTGTFGPVGMNVSPA